MIHVLGDSHTSLFTGLHGVCPRVPDECPQALRGFRVWHLGPFLAYSLAKPRHAVRAIARRCVGEMPETARVLVWMGEIDCRYHFCRHASSDAGIRRMAASVGEEYVRAAKRLLQRREVAFVTVPPPTVAQHGNQLQPTTGTFAKRRVAAKAFNASVRREAKRAGAKVLDVYDALSDARGRPNPAYFADGVHADPRCLPRVLEELVRMGWMASDDAAHGVAEALAKVPLRASGEMPGALADSRDARQLLIEHAAARCRAAGARSIAVYGAGQHTRAMGWAAFERMGLRIACVVDDRASNDARERVGGAAVVSPREARARKGIEAVVISSDAHEDVLLARARSVFGTRMPIIPIYSWRARDAGSR